MKAALILLNLALMGAVAACTDSSHITMMAGSSADGTAAPSIPSASEVFAAEPVPVVPKASKGGTEDMKKTLSKAVEETQMPLVGHGNNHSAPDSSPPITRSKGR